MLSEITLQEGNFSQDLKDSLVRYYQVLGIEGDYAGHLLKKWADDDNIMVYIAAGESGPVGWLVYNPHKSLVKQILVNKDHVGKGMEALMLDALIEKESLVAVEVLRADENTYRVLVDYGFRPMRNYTLDGFDLVKHMLLKIREWRGWSAGKNLKRRDTSLSPPPLTGSRTGLV